ncbi:6845_t:CDS:10, partial [Acaulospora colombiana]
NKWDLQISQPKDLDRTEGRTLSFTEQIYSFRIPTRGEALDVVGLDDRSLFVVTTSPVVLHAIDQEHHKILSIDLYEYFPLQKDSVEGQYYMVYSVQSEHRIRIPNTLQKIDVQGLLKTIPEEVTYISRDGVAQQNVSSARFLRNRNDSNAVSIILNLPDALINEVGVMREKVGGGSGNTSNNNQLDVKILSYMRDSGDDMSNFHKNLKSVSLFLTRSGQLATIIPLEDGRSEGYLEIFNPTQNTLWRVTIPLAISASNSGTGRFDRDVVMLLELPNGDLLTMDISGVARVWQVDAGQLIKAANTWKKLVGNIDQHTLSIIYEDSEGRIISQTTDDIDSQRKTIADGSGSGEGIGGGDGKGEGAGGGEGAGEGGGDSMNLDGRQPTFIDVSNLQIRSEAKPPLELTDAQREFHQMMVKKKLEQVNMTQKDSETYQSYMINVQREIRQLRVILESIEAKNKERVWLKNQSSGDVDDTKL